MCEFVYVSMPVYNAESGTVTKSLGGGPACNAMGAKFKNIVVSA